MAVDLPTTRPPGEPDSPSSPPPILGGVWVRIVVIGAVVLVLLWAFSKLFAEDDSAGVEATATTTSELVTTAPATATTAPVPATTDPSSATTSNSRTPAPSTLGSTTTLEPLTTQQPLSDGRPASFWAITSDSYELIEIDTASGTIIGSVGGWGSLDGCDEDDSCLPQAIDDVELGVDGRLYVADCCEPAYGSVYRLEPGQPFDPTAPFSVGRDPIQSPDGTVIAVSVGPEAALLTPSGQVISTFSPPGGDGFSPGLIPLTWLDDGTTLVMRQVGDLVDNVVFYDASDPTSPAQIGPTLGGTVQHFSAAVRSDGRLVLLSTSRGEGADYWEQLENGLARGRIHDPVTGELITEFELPKGTISIDYDPTGTYLITTQAGGTVQWFGAGKSGTLGNGFVAASW